MASFIVYGDASGQVTVKAPAVAGTNTITFPAETGTLVTSASTIAALPGQINWNTTVQTTGFTAVAYGGYFCNTTSGAFTVTLPATPTRGQFVVIVDYAGTAATNNIVLNPNGGKINGSTSNATMSTNRQGITMVYIDSTQGWLPQSNVYKSGAPYTQPYTLSYLVVAGGAGGGTNSNRTSGGGGAGGLLSGSLSATLGTVYSITIGGGGGSAANGSNTTMTSVTTAVGGGYGASGLGTANTGGSGGGGSHRNSGAAGTPGQGFAGGTGYDSGNASLNFGGGGGGGSSAVGGNAQSSTSGTAGVGGAGTASSITGSSVIYAGGGGGGYQANSTSYGAGPGGSGGGGTGNGSSATFYGSGGGGGGGSGYQGVVILSMPTTNYSGTTTGSPTVTTSGSNTILTYTGSGTYTA